MTPRAQQGHRASIREFRREKRVGRRSSILLQEGTARKSILGTKKEFDFNIEPNLARTMLESRFPQFFRTEKYHLRHTIKDKQGIYLPRHIALSQCPDNIDKIWWEKFINNEYTLKKIEQRKKNAESKALAKITHTLGRKSYSRVYEELKEENPGEPARRTTSWKRAHVNKATGEVLPYTVEKYPHAWNGGLKGWKIYTIQECFWLLRSRRLCRF